MMALGHGPTPQSFYTAPSYCKARPASMAYLR